MGNDEAKKLLYTSVSKQVEQEEVSATVLGTQAQYYFT